LQTLNFSGRVAIITGGGRGIGRAYALLLASRGASVVVNDIGSAPDGSEIANSAVQEVVDEIRRAGGSAVASTASVINVATDIIEAAIDNFGSLSIVINNPGIVTNGDFVDLSDEEWSRICPRIWGER